MQAMTATVHKIDIRLWIASLASCVRPFHMITLLIYFIDPHFKLVRTVLMVDNPPLQMYQQCGKKLRTSAVTTQRITRFLISKFYRFLISTFYRFLQICSRRFTTDSRFVVFLNFNNRKHFLDIRY